jgi:hypothetical protein
MSKSVYIFWATLYFGQKKDPAPAGIFFSNPGPFIQQPTRYMDYAIQAHVQIML